MNENHLSGFPLLQLGFDFQAFVAMSMSSSLGEVGEAADVSGGRWWCGGEVNYSVCRGWDM
jgi:hypothetical protein